MLKPEVKKKWLKALRSGDYRQGRLGLKNTTGKRNYSYHCCLGVLCEIHAEETGRRWSKSTSSGRERAQKYMRREDALSHTVLTWSSLIETEQAELIMMNDSGKSFATIADYIEKNL